MALIFLLVQIYVDDIIFYGCSHTLVSRFQKMMESEFQMSMIEELTFFLGIQVKQTKQGAFMHQAKYTKELMKKFNMAELKPVTTSMSTAMSVGPDEDGETVDQREYKSMIDSLLYLTATRPNIQFTVGCVHAFRLPHALHVGWQFSKSLSISNTSLSLGFGILLFFFT
jgi:isopentenyldiphosphate isomerase